MKLFKKGFTLIELIIVIVLIGILSGISSLMLTQFFKSYQTGKRLNNLAIQTNIEINNLMREIKNAESVSIIGNTTMTFINHNGETVAIDLNGTNLRRNVNSSGAQIVCDKVSSLSFGFFDQAFNTTAVATNVRFVTINIVASEDNLPYALMTGTTLRKLIP